MLFCKSGSKCCVRKKFCTTATYAVGAKLLQSPLIVFMGSFKTLLTGHHLVSYYENDTKWCPFKSSPYGKFGT